MQPLQVYSVIPRLPESLNPLWDLAYNFWFSWNHEITEIFSQMDFALWERSRHNPVWFLNHLPQERLEALAQDPFFLDRVQAVLESLQNYHRKSASPLHIGEENGNGVVAYFSAEYGVALSLPVYSGGLGILAGDHLKSASDLNLPLVAVGLCYQRGYFRQNLTRDGWQQERYPTNDFEQLPLTLIRDDGGSPLTISLQLQGRTLYARVWRALVGRISLFLLDTNIAENPADFREITAQLYGGGLEMRLRQEFLLGIGGVKALHAMGIEPKVVHMNEGHSAFAGLERIRVFMKHYGLSFEAAMELVASSSVFTTHTPVPAGNDRFSPSLMEAYFVEYARELGLAFKVFLALGREDPRDEAEQFCMTVLALRLSRFNNGVSKLHGRVSRDMWKRVWPQYPVEDVPIEAITNGIHVPTWVAPDMAYLFDRYLGGNWREDPDCERVGEKYKSIPEVELWRTHERLRERLVGFVRARLREQIMARGGRNWELQVADDVLNPQALTIGFARRFATYKRAYLLLREKDRLLEILGNSQRPVQFIFAGKAHPQDNEGKKLIQKLVELCQSEAGRYSAVFIEDYDMEIASYMIQGCDVWLNTPRRPLEACGTSGMKAMVNGVLNLSTFDGWWAEAYKADNSVGWSIGHGEEYQDSEYQDFVESQILYNILEKDVVPTFYDRSHGGLPRRWIKKMKDALTCLGPVFNSHRMVEEYANKTYTPACSNFARLAENQFEPAKGLAAWRMDLMTKWGELRIRNVVADARAEIFVGEPLRVTAEVYANGLRPEDIQVELYTGPLDQVGTFSKRTTAVMTKTGSTSDGWLTYSGEVSPDLTGKFGFTVRILPHHPLLLDPHSLGLIHWA
ncbi:MAG TPA: alpha-glucan family phosphorylase [Desulfomicrobiaceae bacterium]|nr:alpha-glucan family phosphorylase [Desulfomicrobiaceae bacterium]